MRLVLAVAALTLLAPVAGASAPVALQADEPVVERTACAPPCGEINPRILFSFPDLDRTPLELQQGDSVTFEGSVTYWADTDDEGYVPPDPQQPIVIQFSFPRLPDWAKMSVEPQQIEVDAITCPTCFAVNADDPSQPTAHYEYVTNLTVTLELVGPPERTTGYDYGKLQLFAKSTESGIYNPGYGIKEVRVASGPGEDIDQNSFDVPLSGLSAVAAVALAALGVATYRRLR